MRYIWDDLFIPKKIKIRKGLSQEFVNLAVKKGKSFSQLLDEAVELYLEFEQWDREYLDGLEKKRLDEEKKKDEEKKREKKRIEDLIDRGMARWCKCGCGNAVYAYSVTDLPKSYIRGHKPPAPLCKCGCGKPVKTFRSQDAWSDFIAGHFRQWKKREVIKKALHMTDEQISVRATEIMATGIKQTKKEVSQWKQLQDILS